MKCCTVKLEAIELSMVKKGLDLTFTVVRMSTSAPILSADFPHAMAECHGKDFQIYVLE